MTRLPRANRHGCEKVMGYLLRPRSRFGQCPNWRGFRLGVGMTPRGLQASRRSITDHAQAVTTDDMFTAMTPSGRGTRSSISLPRRALRCLSVPRRLGRYPLSASHARAADPNLYAREPKKFDSLMKRLEASQTQLAALENEWLELEEKRAALAGG